MEYRDTLMEKPAAPKRIGFDLVVRDDERVRVPREV
jgi:hypothetical protein